MMKKKVVKVKRNNVVMSGLNLQYTWSSMMAARMEQADNDGLFHRQELSVYGHGSYLSLLPAL